MTDIEIAQQSTMLPIEEIAAKIGIGSENLEHYGHYKAKVDIHALKELPRKSKLVLVTAISPTPAGEGKTTTSVGLADALNKIGKKTIVCLREPSLGPVFGVKGGAAGGGGTVAAYMANRNIDTLDAGVPVLSMHSPFETVGKLDCYMTFKGMKAIFEAL